MTHRVRRLTLTSLQAENQDFIIRALGEYLKSRLEIPVDFIVEPNWRERERMLDEGEIHIAWICGLPYVHKMRGSSAAIELLAAPVMKGERYRNRPVYFSDVLVRAASPYRRFADLRGARWAYNEPGSQSGYNITRYQLAKLGEPRGFFGRSIESGSHQR
jgi:phosphonate transport system substrate-binding protein